MEINVNIIKSACYSLFFQILIMAKTQYNKNHTEFYLFYSDKQILLLLV